MRLNLSSKWGFWRLLFCVAALWASGEILPHDRIHVAIDKYSGRNPSMDQNLTHRIMEIRLIDRPIELKRDVDVIAHADWENFRKYFRKSLCPICHLLVDRQSVTLFEDKLRWKAWMVANDLGNYIPNTLSDANFHSLVFPVVLKTTMVRPGRQHGGNGVHIVPNLQELQNLTSTIVAHKHQYFLEEPLTGLGMSEMSSFGSVFRGKVRSIRCYQRVFSTEKIRVSKFNAAFNATQYDVGPLYIKGGTLIADDDYAVPCGKEVVRVVTTMFALTNYTGPYCTNWKFDRYLRPKMLEVNARICGTLSKPYAGALVVATFVPLAYAFLSANADPVYHARSALLHSNHSALYQRILAEEQRALQSGGGWIEGQWVEPAHYDKDKRLTPILDTFHRT